MTKEEAIKLLNEAPIMGMTRNNSKLPLAEAIEIAIEALMKPEIIHAHWIRGQYDFEAVPQMVDDKLTLGKAAHYHCSNCGCVLAHMRRNYCPDCGAKMDEEI